MKQTEELSTSFDIEESWAYLRRKTYKKMFEFNVMVLGEPGIGKTSLINELFEIETTFTDQLPINESFLLYYSKKDPKYPLIEMKTHNYEVERGKHKVKLTIVEAPNLGEALDSKNSWTPISDYIDGQFEKYLQEESGINRRNIRDTRVHCILYLINPNSKKLKQLDIDILKNISCKCNLLPVIAKADMYTNEELMDIKHKIRKQLEEEHICIYPFPEYDPDESEEFNHLNTFLKNNYPLSIVSGGNPITNDNRIDYSRKYPWGTLITNDPKLSDINLLKIMFRKTHVNDFKDVTEQLHYENYRTWRLGGSHPNERPTTINRELMV